MSDYIEQDGSGATVGSVAKRSFTFAEPDREMTLESGAALGPITLAYETCGTLNADKSNAVLILHALTGDAHVAGYHRPEDPKPGWWDSMVGPGKGIDTDRYFVICSNVLGSCVGTTGPSSINPATDRPYGGDFPVITITDIVRAQKQLVDHLGIEKLLCVVGGSVGGMQVLEWCARYPDMMVSAIPLATTTRHSAQAIAFNEVARQAIMTDSNWNSGDYYASDNPDMGLAVARMIGHITYLSDEAMGVKFGRKLQDRSALSFEFGGDFQVESYLRYQGKKFVERFDANSFLYITKAADYFDLARDYGAGSLKRAIARFKARFLVVSYTSDWLYPTYQSKEMVKAMKQNNLDVSFCEIKAKWGHDAFLLPGTRLDSLISGFLTGVGDDL
ncbi:MAG: homoserine O-acetyltransferase [Desulfobacterium sp.]|nr:homoserine O-acetyltransferase [Desulfobacterium sp.]